MAYRTYSNHFPLATERRRWYRKVYQKSPRWQTLRRRARARACDFCEGDKCHNLGEQIHHTSYRHVDGDIDKELADIQWLCRPCHAKAHGLFHVKQRQKEK